VALIELLAPAKDAACGIAAIDAGADAVYIGATKFGAREAAGNALDDIAALVAHAHRYWARVYVTLNTLLTDDELPAAVALAHEVHARGVDGLIIQDVGLLECDLPPLPLIASTQMHNHTPERVAFLEQVGFQRAILARELTLEEIRAIRAQTTLELECFVHGALCVCYSGQCYLSYAHGGRSGNRGQCAQPCRKAYRLYDAEGHLLARDKHLLSLRDLNLSNDLGALLDAGVTSFKIEGRLKDQAYVTNVVRHYRARLDAEMAARGLRRASSGTSEADFTPDVGKTFNRGYSTYFLHGRTERVGAPDTPKMTGEPVGTVVTVGRYRLTLQGDVPLHNGDGLCFFTAAGVLAGTTVNGVHGNVITVSNTEGITPGMPIFRNHDHAFLTRLAKAEVVRVIDVAFTLRPTPDGVALHARDEDGVEAQAAVVCDDIAAQKPEAALTTIQTQLAKCGGTEFACTGVAVETGPRFFPVALLNALRRDALDALRAARAAARPAAHGGVRVNDAPFPAKALTYTGNVLNRRAADFYRRHGVMKIEPAAESGLDLRGRVVMTTRHCVRRELGLCERPAKPLLLVDEEGRKLGLRFACLRCEMEVVLP
jgi:putative protease